MSKSIVVKRYKNDKEYERDAGRMNKRGYKVVTVTSERPRRSYVTVILTGFIVLLFPRKAQYVVTYSLT